MGQSQATQALKDTKFELKVDPELNDILKEEVKPVNTNISKAITKKGTKFLKFSSKGKTQKQLYVKNAEIFNLNENSDDEESEEEENEIQINYITELVDLIYSKNINFQLKNRPNNTVYETVFDIRNILDSKEDLNNNEYNNKSCKIMNELIEPDVSDKIKNEKKENDNNQKKDEEENEENSNEEKSDSVEHDFFKNWDYNEDIFADEKFEENEIELNLDFYENNKDKDKLNKSTELLRNKSRKETKTLKRNKTDDNIFKKRSAKIDKKKLIMLEDIITYDNKNDINKINNYIIDNINRCMNVMSQYINNNIENEINNNNSLENSNKNLDINDQMDINPNNNKININKRNDTNMQTENFEIINNEDLLNTSIKNNNNDNSNEIMIRNNKDISRYFKDDEKSENLNIKDFEKNAKKELLDISDTSFSKRDSVSFSINEQNINNKSDTKKVMKKNIIYDKSKNIIYKNPNAKLYRRKKLDLNKNNSNNNSKIILKNKTPITQNENNMGNIDFNNISAIQKNEKLNSSNNTNSYVNKIYSPKIIRSKTPINKKIKKKKLIITNNNDNNKEKDYYLKPSEFNKSQLYVTKVENLDFPKSDKKYISKTPIKQLRKKTAFVKKPKLIINLMEDEYQKNKMNNDLNNINKTITLVEQKIKSIEKYDKKYKNLINSNNKYTNNNININNITPIIKPKRHKKKNKLRSQKTYDEIDIKGYKDIMPQINKEREQKNNINYNPIFLNNRTKSSEIQLKKKKAKKENKNKRYENIDNYIFGKQKYYNDNYNNQDKENINNMRTGMRKKYEE